MIEELRIVFLGHGMMYAYRHIHDCQVTSRFYLVGQLCIDPVSYLTDEPSMEYIAPITKECTVYELDATAKAEITRFPEWAVLWEKISVNTLISLYSGDGTPLFRSMVTPLRGRPKRERAVEGFKDRV